MEIICWILDSNLVEVGNMFCENLKGYISHKTVNSITSVTVKLLEFLPTVLTFSNIF